MARLVSSARSGVAIEIDGTLFEFGGEAFLPGHGAPDFVFYSDQVTDASTGRAIEAPEAEVYLEALEKIAAEEGWTIEIERPPESS